MKGERSCSEKDMSIMIVRNVKCILLLEERRLRRRRHEDGENRLIMDFNEDYPSMSVIRLSYGNILRAGSNTHTDG